VRAARADGARRVLLSTQADMLAAHRLYRRLGFTDVIRGYHFAGDPRPFAILGRGLPLEPADHCRV
jgi:ribosomal protein S18 acetylase RimI-like enzyme